MVEPPRAKRKLDHRSGGAGLKPLRGWIPPRGARRARGRRTRPEAQPPPKLSYVISQLSIFFSASPGFCFVESLAHHVLDPHPSCAAGRTIEAKGTHSQPAAIFRHRRATSSGCTRRLVSMIATPVERGNPGLKRIDKPVKVSILASPEPDSHSRRARLIASNVVPR